MRKITAQAVAALMKNASYRGKNTKVIDGGLFLHNNLIAELVGEKLRITAAGWFTNTTKERLNGLPGVKIQQKAGQWYLNGREWSGKWVNIASGGDWKYTKSTAATKNPGKIPDNYTGMFKSIAMVAKMGEIINAGNQKAANDWKARMLKAGLGNAGLVMPADWEYLSDDEKTKRLDSAIGALTE